MPRFKHSFKARLSKLQLPALLALISFYAFNRTLTNLNDDHGLVISAALRIRDGFLPGLNEPYPHGVLSPILLGKLFSIAKYLELDWQFAYILASIIQYLIFFASINSLLDVVFSLRAQRRLTISLLVTLLAFWNWGGFYHDYLSVIICLFSITLFHLGFSKCINTDFLPKSKLRPVDAFLFLGFLMIINPLLIKVTSSYFSLAIAIAIIACSFNIILKKGRQAIKDQLRIWLSLFSGFVIALLTICLVINRYDIGLSKFLEASFSPLFYANDLQHYSILKLPTLYNILQFALIFFLLYSYHFKLDKYTSIVRAYTLLLISCLAYQLFAFWGRDHQWLCLLFGMLYFTSYPIKSYHMSNANAIFKAAKKSLAFILLISPIVSIVHHLRSYSWYLSNRYIDFNHTPMSMFHIREYSGWGNSQDVVDIAKSVAPILNNDRTISGYSYMDDNSYLLPLLLNRSASQKLSFIQYNKTIFKKDLLPNLQPLNSHTLFIVCLPFRLPAEKWAQPSALARSLLTLGANDLPQNSLKFSNIRYFRVEPPDPAFEWIRGLLSFNINLLQKTHRLYISNHSCAVYLPNTIPRGAD